MVRQNNYACVSPMAPACYAPDAPTLRRSGRSILRGSCFSNASMKSLFTLKYSHQTPDGERSSFDTPKNSRKAKNMKGRTLVAGGFLSVALLSSSINGIPQAAAMEDAPIPTTPAATCPVSDQAASAEVSLNEIARPSTSASLSNLSISAVSTLSEPNMTNSALPMHTKRDCHRAYERDSKRCRKAPGGARGRAICWTAIATKYATCLAGANG